MKQIKLQIFIALSFLVIGLAAVTTNLFIEGSTLLSSNQEDFMIYFSDVKVNGTQDLSLVKNERELVFSKEFSAVGDKITIEYDVTNASKNYDAIVSISCTESNNYLNVTNNFDQTSNLQARSTKTGTLTIELTNAVTEEKSYEVKCIVTATATSRENEGEGNIVNSPQLKKIFSYEDSDLSKNISIGDILKIESEKFYVLSQTEDTVTMLSNYNLGPNYRQTSTASYTSFSNTNGWAYTPGPKDIDIFSYDGNTKTYLIEYANYLNETIGVSNITTDLMTMSDLKKLGCTLNSDYSFVSDATQRTCENSEYSSWLINGQYWWTKSAKPDSGAGVWIVNAAGDLDCRGYTDNRGVRAVVTIPKYTISKISYKDYDKNGISTGDALTIAEEKFNIISMTDNVVTALAQKNIDANYRQTATASYTSFSNTNGWAYSPGPKDIDIYSYDGNTKTYLIEYANYLNETLGISSITTDLITMSELKKLGCTLNSDYSYVSETSQRTCETSRYSSWLINGQYWWTKSAKSDSGGSVWIVNSSGPLDCRGYTDNRGVRPLINIPLEEIM